MGECLVDLAAFDVEIAELQVQVEQRLQRSTSGPEHRTRRKVEQAVGLKRNIKSRGKPCRRLEIAAPIYPVPHRFEVLRRDNAEIRPPPERIEHAAHNLRRAQQVLEQERPP